METFLTDISKSFDERNSEGRVVDYKNLHGSSFEKTDNADLY